MIEHDSRPADLDAPGTVRIYPAFGASGAWDVDGAVLDPAADLGLPGDLVERFRRWIVDYDLMCEPAAEIDAEVLTRFDAEGLSIAQATRAHLGTGRRVFYAPEAQYHGVVTAKWIET
jgi:hypothetical protein